MKEKEYSEDDRRRRALLLACLGAAVPLWSLKWEERLSHWTDQQVTDRAQQLATDIASHGDVILYKEKNKSAAAFNSLAEALALMARHPGGVEFLGERWEVPSGRRDLRGVVPAQMFDELW